MATLSDEAPTWQVADRRLSAYVGDLPAEVADAPGHLVEQQAAILIADRPDFQGAPPSEARAEVADRWLGVLVENRSPDLDAVANFLDAVGERRSRADRAAVAQMALAAADRTIGAKRDIAIRYPDCDGCEASMRRETERLAKRWEAPRRRVAAATSDD